MKAQRRYLDDAQHNWLRQWWQALQPQQVEAASKRPGELHGLGRADRARLRRCAGLDDLLLEPATHRLAGRLLMLEANKQWPRFTTRDYAPLALLGGALARVNEDLADGASLAARLGDSKPGEQAPMSELRFRRLQQVRTADDFYRQLVRALQLAKNKTDLASLAEDVLAWSLEQQHPIATPSDSLKFRWARDYYLSAPVAGPHNNQEQIQ